MSMPVRDVNLGGIQAEVGRRADGTQIVRANQPLPKYPDKLTARLDHWATVTPKRTFIAQRGPDGDWRQLTYEDARDRARGIGRRLSTAVRAFLSAQRLRCVRPTLRMTHKRLKPTPIYSRSSAERSSALRSASQCRARVRLRPLSSASPLC